MTNQFNLTSHKTSQQTSNLTRIPTDCHQSLDIILVIWNLIFQFLQEHWWSWTWELHDISPCKVINNKIDSVSEQDTNVYTNKFLVEEGKIICIILLLERIRRHWIESKFSIWTGFSGSITALTRRSPKPSRMEWWMCTLLCDQLSYLCLSTMR